MSLALEAVVLHHVEAVGEPVDGRIAEAQATAEGACYDEEALLRLLRLARMGCDRIFAAQAEAVRRL